MIKVNLLKEHTVQTRRIVTGASRPSLLGLLLLVALALVTAGVGGAWFLLHRDILVLTDARDRLKAENERVQNLRKEIDRFDKMTRQRQSRIDIIEQLKLNQTGPVLLLNHVVHSIPANAVLWLTALEQKGDQVRITGYTVRGETIPDFMTNLSATGFFRTVDLEIYEDQDKDAVKFTLVCVNANKALPE
jgi:Tfp pilus assembly protein PilN